MATKGKKSQDGRPVDALDVLAAGDPREVIALMLWKARRQQPDLYVQITEQDILGYQACVNFQKIEPEVRITRPAGLPAQAAVQLRGGRAFPAREATPPKPYVLVALMQKGTGDAFRPIENNQDDFDISEEASAIRRAKERAPTLAQILMRQAQTGEFSLSDMQDCADALMLLARS